MKAIQLKSQIEPSQFYKDVRFAIKNIKGINTVNAAANYLYWALK